jgi:hypothetical protein
MLLRGPNSKFIETQKVKHFSPAQVERREEARLARKVVPVGTLLNWTRCHFLGRMRPMHWMRQGETYYTAVERVRLEREQKRRPLKLGQLTEYRLSRMFGKHHLTQPPAYPVSYDAPFRRTPRDLRHGDQQLQA